MKSPIHFYPHHVTEIDKFRVEKNPNYDKMASMVKPLFSLGPSDDAKFIRTEVFCKEQGFKNEFDELDASSISLVLYLDDAPIATGRLIKIDPATYQIGRIAVLKPYRGKKIGSYLMEFLAEKARTMGAKTTIVHAQLDKRAFYNRLGYYEFDGGVIDYDEGVPHIYLAHQLYSPYRPKRK